MTPSIPTAWLVHGTGILVLALWACRARSFSAAVRHAVLASAILAQPVLLLPSLTGATLDVPVPARFAGLMRGADDEGLPVAADRRLQSRASTQGAPRSPAGPGMALEGGRQAWAPGIRPEGKRSNGPFPYLTILWVTGSAFLGVRLLIGLTFASERTRRCRVLHGVWRDDLRMVAERLGTRPVELRVGPAFAAPVTVGILRSSIVLPRDAVRWKQPTRVAVLTHEMAHVARRDVAVNALVGLATAVAWWNPVVWHVRRRLRDEAERACDDVVLRAGRSAPDYVLDLIGVARATIAEPTGTCAADLLRGDTLSRRVMHILETGRRRSPATRAAVAAAFGSAMGLAGLLGSARLVPARHASAVPPQDAAVAWRSACPYDGRGHRDRVVIRDGAPVWDVYWEGRDCEVAVTASGALASLGDRDEGSTALPFGASLLRPRAAGSSLTITIRRGADVRSIRLTYGVPSDVTDEWLAAFAVELDRHTGFAAALRFDRLWADGGFDRVLEEARTTTAGHAAAPYLIALIETRPDPVRWVRLLRVAGSRVRVRAARGRLFEAIRGMAPLDDPDVRAALDAAFPGAELPNLRAPAVGE